jgi:protein-S-isoprenylcysteine O-methyltransferase Ste14
VKRVKSWQAWSMVTAQFVLIGLLALLPGGGLYPVGAILTVVAGALVAAGIVIAVLAGARLGGSLTPSPIPRDSGELTTSGLYRFVRHPIYSALLLAAIGLALRGASVSHVLVLVALIVLISVKARAEESMLFKKYDDYGTYASQVGRFIPGVGRIPLGGK